MSSDVLFQLAATIRARRSEGADRSYTRQLLDGGPERCAKKLGEEAVETVIASVRGDRAGVVAESADLLYHLLVVLALANVSVEEVMAELEKRTGRSGIAEKASRGSD